MVSRFKPAPGGFITTVNERARSRHTPLASRAIERSVASMPATGGQAPLYRGTVLAMPSEIEAEGSMGEIAAERIAWRRAGSLPQTFRHQDTILLLSDLALALARLRARLPADLPLRAAEAWLTSRSTVGAITYLSDSPLERSKP